ncbi:hypothetical protein [Acidaminobacter hydrogenoformans]|uniref:Uncharacterized protein n=1 Tax=Acidaminobacter hydrogenoformans DSM 2784 TaxID=1120920 RepID=A0A1G5RXP9_9FIRM|nr:hypothetical protein [Acidaminobacter hydrogenoformans]SCZ78109.1 hypothetical protein SAMN03080599_01068 [Acidaminobacter hydrogenoformans DSM 2784]
MKKIKLPRMPKVISKIRTPKQIKKLRQKLIKIKVLPDTLAGKASVICAVSFYLLISVSNLAFDFQNQPWAIGSIGEIISHVLLLVAISALAAATILGAYAIYKLKDYSLMVVFSTLLGIAVYFVQK